MIPASTLAKAAFLSSSLLATLCHLLPESARPPWFEDLIDCVDEVDEELRRVVGASYDQASQELLALLRIVDGDLEGLRLEHVLPTIGVPLRLLVRHDYVLDLHVERALGATDAQLRTLEQARLADGTLVPDLECHYVTSSTSMEMTPSSKMTSTILNS